MSQALAYMMANPVATPSFGVVTNGEDTVFVKLDRSSAQFETSTKISLSRQGDNQPYQVLQILKRLKAFWR